MKRSDCCRRCGIKRRSRWDAYIFTRGMCGHCYNLLRSFGFSEAAAQAHEELQKLKQEIRDGKAVQKVH